MLINKENSQIYYLIPIDDNNTMLISEVSRQTTNNNLCEDFYNLYAVKIQLKKKLEPYESSEVKTKILIPCFKKIDRSYCGQIEILKGVEISKKGKEAKIVDINEYSELSFDNDSEFDNSVKISEFCDSVVIKEEFLFGKDKQ
jgi:hypothetical protein